MLTAKDLKELLDRLPSSCQELAVEVIINGEYAGEIVSVTWDNIAATPLVVLAVTSDEVEAAINGDDEDEAGDAHE